MNTYAILISVITAFIGAFVGTFLGAYLINRKKESEMEKVRKIAIKGLDIIKKYVQNEGTYCKVKEEFNNTLNIAEKRAVLVCLHKLGVPIEMPIGNTFDIKNIQFLSKPIKNDEIEGMTIQINNGYCDHLFFMDVDTYFTANTRIKTIRNIGKRFVTEVILNSKFDSQSGKLTYPQDWRNKFSYGEYQMIGVFWDSIRSGYFFDSQTGNPNIEKIDKLIQEIEFGLWDFYLTWDYDSYKSMLAQKESAEKLTDLIEANMKNSIRK